MDTGKLFTWEALSALGGASLLTYLVVLYTKELIARLAPSLPTAIYAVLVASFILTLAQLAVGASVMDWRVFALAFANGFLVAATAGHMNEKALNPPGAERRRASIEDQ